MLCPNCRVELKMTDRQGVEVDYCPQCRGVWLDRGELDKIIERSASITPPSGQYEPYREPQYREPVQNWGREWDDDDDARRGRYPQRRRRGWLGDIFDFD